MYEQKRNDTAQEMIRKYKVELNEIKKIQKNLNPEYERSEESTLD